MSLYKLVKELEMENEINNLSAKCSTLQIYGKKELMSLKINAKELIKKILRSNLPAKDKKYFLSQLISMHRRIDYQILNRERWKVNLFEGVIASAFASGMGLGYFISDLLSNYELKKYVECLQTINK